jgi:hypothetical protein
MSTFYLNKINNVGVKQQNQVTISNSFAVLENLDFNVYVNEAIQVVDRIQKLHPKSLLYYELMKHELRFDEVLGISKQVKLQ